VGTLRFAHPIPERYFAFLRGALVSAARRPFDVTIDLAVSPNDLRALAEQSNAGRSSRQADVARLKKSPKDE